MPTLHDAAYREELKLRLRKVQADSARKWGSMTPDQMMWHLSQGLQQYLGKGEIEGIKAPFPMPKSLMRWMVIHGPWPKGAPTMPSMKAVGQHDLEAERARCLRLVDEFTARPIAGAWLVHPQLGEMTGTHCSQLQARHIDHHLTQFSA